MKPQPLNLSIKCEKRKRYFLLSLLAFVWVRLLAGLMSLVHRVQKTGLNVYTSLHHLLTSTRHLVGVILLVLAPISGMLYLLFDSTPPPEAEYAKYLEEWYFLKWHYFLNELSPYLVMLFGSLGAFLLFPTKNKISYIAVSGSVSYALLWIIQISFFVKSQSDYDSLSWIPIASSISIGVGIVLATDYLLYRKFHLNDGNLARINGIIKTPGVPAEQKVKILESLIEERENFYARV